MRGRCSCFRYLDLEVLCVRVYLFVAFVFGAARRLCYFWFCWWFNGFVAFWAFLDDLGGFVGFDVRWFVLRVSFLWRCVSLAGLALGFHCRVGAQFARRVCMNNARRVYMNSGLSSAVNAETRWLECGCNCCAWKAYLPWTFWTTHWKSLHRPAETPGSRTAAGHRARQQYREGAPTSPFAKIRFLSEMLALFQ